VFHELDNIQYLVDMTLNEADFNGFKG